MKEDIKDKVSREAYGNLETKDVGKSMRIQIKILTKNKQSE